jgi:photosystem II stability/assembly factor-like uncharacterized protein
MQVHEGAEAEAEYAEDFEGGRAIGWALEEGWGVARDPDGPMCLRGRGHRWARLERGQWDDLSLGLRLRLVRGTVHINLRTHGPRRYFVGLQRDHVYLAKQLGPESFIGDLARGEIHLPGNRFAWIEISCHGPLIMVQIDGQRALEYEDRDPLVAGSIAFETLEDSEVFIDQVSVVVGGVEEPWRESRRAELEPERIEVEPHSGELEAQQDDMEPGRAKVRPGPREVEPSTIAVEVAAATVVSLPVGPEAAPRTVTAAMPSMVDMTQIQRAIRWEYLGGPVGGLGYDVRIHPSRPQIMYVSDAWAGVFKSTNGGTTWAPRNKGITVHRGKTNEAFPIFCLTVNHLKPRVIWAGTKDDRGIFRSGDGSQTWTKMDQYLPLNNAQGKPIVKGVTFRGFTVHPTRPEVVWAAAELTSLAWNNNIEVKGKSFDAARGVVFRTDNDGKTWTKVWEGQSLARYVIVNPKNPKVIYISTGIFDRECANSTATQPGGVGVMKTTTGGNKTGDWFPVNSGLGNLYIGSLFMHPTTPDVLLAGAGANPWRQSAGVYLTTNGGASWELKLETPGNVVTSVEFAADGKIAFAGTAETIYRSLDGGNSWERMTPSGTVWGPDGIRAGWPIDFQVDPRSSNRLFANAYGGGNFLSTDGGVSWTNASQGYSGAQVRIVEVDPKNSSTVFAAGLSGVFVSHDGGRTWSGLNRNPAQAIDWQMFAMDPTQPQHVIGASLWGPQMLFESYNGGQTWTQAQALNNNALGWRCAEFALSNPSRVYAGVGGRATFGQFHSSLPGNGVWTSTNGGATWSPANGGLCQNAHVFDLAVHPTRPFVVYAATYNHGLLRSDNNGSSWQARNPTTKQVSNPRTISVAMHPKDPKILFLGLEHGGLWRSKDGGVSWHSFMNGIDPNASISSLVFDPTEPRIMYCSDLKSGVYRWHNGDSVWRKINLDLWIREVNDLAITSDGKTLYAASEGAGVFRCQTSP